MATTVVKPVSNGRAVEIAPSSTHVRCLTNFIAAVAATARPGPQREAAQRLIEKEYKTGHKTTGGTYVVKTPLGVLSGAVGGYLVPPEWTYELMRVVSEESFIYPRATKLPMNSLTLNAPRIDIETTPTSGNAPWFGGASFTWGASQAPTETADMKFRDDVFTAWDLLGYAVVSNQLLSDAGPAGDKYLLQTLGRAAAWYAEFAFLQGGGSPAKMPMGILNSPALISTTRVGAGHIANGDVSNIAAKMLPYGWIRAIWACNPSSLADITKITGYITNARSNQELGMAGFLMERPLFITDKLPALGTKGDLLFFDPSLYSIGERTEVIIDVSEHTLFQNNQTVLRVWLRCDAMPEVQSAITLQDTSTTVSPYVCIAT